jgi:hypothetical protein
MARLSITGAFNCGVQRDGARYWESIHKGVLPAQKAAQSIADKRRKTFSVYKWDEARTAALLVSVHTPSV